jgi:hypothetical protein
MTSLKLHPLIGTSALQHHCGGGWRIWCIARGMDDKGSGKINQADLYSRLRELGVSDHNRGEWIREAERAGLIERHTYKRDGTKVILITGLARGADLLGCPKIGPAVYMTDPSKLFVRYWRSNLWDAFLATTDGKPVSQITKENITGISPRVQRNYIEHSSATKTINIAQTQYTIDSITGLNENSHRHYFIMNKQVYQRLPDSFSVPASEYYKAPKGSTRNAQARLDKLRSQGSDILQSSFHFSSSVPPRDCYGQRIFNRTYAELKATNKKLARLDSSNKPDTVFHEPQKFKKRYMIWNTEVV